MNKKYKFDEEFARVLEGEISFELYKILKRKADVAEGKSQSISEYEKVSKEIEAATPISIQVTIRIPGTIYCGNCNYKRTSVCYGHGDYRDECGLFESYLKQTSFCSEENSYHRHYYKCDKCLEKMNEK